MQAEELRINNMVSIIGQPSGERFNYSLSSGQSIDMIFVKRNNHYPKPIPLTEEWLVKFGFEYEGGMGFKSPHNTSNWHFSIRNGFIPSIWVSGTILSDGYKGCKYVHQLQNLYFELTQEELIIK
jgi:hypothetical protein